MSRRAGLAGEARRILLGIIVAVVVVGLVMAVGCGAPPSRALPPPSSNVGVDPTTSTTRPDYSLVVLEPVPGETTTTAPMATGHTTLQGSVQGPDGPVPGAVIRADRLVGRMVQRTEVLAAEDGTFAIPNLPGGRFRVRAYLPGSLTMAEAEVFYVADGETNDLRLLVEDFTGLVVHASTNPGRPVVGAGVNLAVLVARRTVDADGIGQEVPEPGAIVRVSTTGWTELDDDPLARTGSDGIVVFEYRCDRVGSVSATVAVETNRVVTTTSTTTTPGAQPTETSAPGRVETESGTFPLDPPPCAPEPTTTTTTTIDDDGDGGGPSSTTTTTDDPDG